MTAPTDLSSLLWAALVVLAGVVSTLAALYHRTWAHRLKDLEEHHREFIELHTRTVETIARNNDLISDLVEEKRRGKR